MSRQDVRRLLCGLTGLAITWAIVATHVPIPAGVFLVWGGIVGGGTLLTLYVMYAEEAHARTIRIQEDTDD